MKLIPTAQDVLKAFQKTPTVVKIGVPLAGLAIGCATYNQAQIEAMPRITNSELEKNTINFLHEGEIAFWQKAVMLPEGHDRNVFTDNSYVYYDPGHHKIIGEAKDITIGANDPRLDDDKGKEYRLKNLKTNKEFTITTRGKLEFREFNQDQYKEAKGKYLAQEAIRKAKREKEIAQQEEWDKANAEDIEAQKAKFKEILAFDKIVIPEGTEISRDAGGGMYVSIDARTTQGDNGSGSSMSTSLYYADGKIRTNENGQALSVEEAGFSKEALDLLQKLSEKAELEDFTTNKDLVLPKQFQ